MSLRPIAALALTLVAMTLSACPGKPAKPPVAPPTQASGQQQTTAQPQTLSPDATSSSTTPTDTPGLGQPTAVAPPIKQLVLIYTGDTLSAMQAINRHDKEGQIERRGGLPALTGEVIAYEARITAITRDRVLASGGDIASIRTDPQKGLLGEHPYFLLDYGGWERATDPQGQPYLELQFAMFKKLGYHALGCQLYEQLTAPYWKNYAGIDGPAVFVNSAGPPRPEARPTLPVVTREVHGSLWGIVSAPLPVKDTPDGPALQAYVDQAAGALAKAGCKYGILLCKGGPKALYQKLQSDKRFTVVIGVSPPELCAPQGQGPLPTGGPLMLPELNWGGQQFGTCHLIYAPDGAAPLRYNLELHTVVEDIRQPFPYRDQATAAVAKRQFMVDDAKRSSAGK